MSNLESTEDVDMEWGRFSGSPGDELTCASRAQRRRTEAPLQSSASGGHFGNGASEPDASSFPSWVVVPDQGPRDDPAGNNAEKLRKDTRQSQGPIHVFRDACAYVNSYGCVCNT